MISLHYVPVEELNAQDMYWIAMGCHRGPDLLARADKIVDRLEAKELALFRLVGETEGIVITEVVRDEELYIYLVSCKGYFKHFDEIHAAAKVVARSAGLGKISGLVSAPGLQRLYEQRTQAKRVAALYVEEL